MDIPKILEAEQVDYIRRVLRENRLRRRFEVKEDEGIGRSRLAREVDRSTGPTAGQ